MMKTFPARVLLLAALATGAIGTETAPADPDPQGVLLKPVPDRLVVLTFDDGPASGYTVVAPVLKSLGFNGTFYICDFDSFRTRKDWYMTWRQMKALADDGFEIGNHTVGHGGGLNNYLAMEDHLLANNVPKPTTVCWPVYQVVWSICPDLSANGYLFGRGGHSRAYRPTVDHPFDVPSFSVQDNVSVETFIGYVQKACQGRIVVITFHGVPDMEHPSVGLEPETFKVMMQYMKDNRYTGIAMRDLARYIDPARAATLPHTAGDVKEPAPPPSLQDDKPYVAAAAKDIKSFSFPGLPGAGISRNRIAVTVPHATDVTALVPNIAVSAEATVAPASGTRRDFSQPQTYTVTAKDGSTKAYTVTVNRTAVSKARDILTFALPGPIPGVISGTRIGVTVPATTDVKALAPAFTLSPFASAVPASGTALDLTRPQTYTITAQDGSTQVYTVTVVKSDKPNAFTWGKAEAGAWSDGSKWLNRLADGSAPVAAGRPDYVLIFNKSGSHAVTNDLEDGFQLNQLNLEESRALRLDGKRIVFTADRGTGCLPQINVNTSSESDHITLPLELAADVTVNVKLRGRLFLECPISGSGRLTLNCPGSVGDRYDNWGLLRIQNKVNTYNGGTVINGGQLFLLGAPQGLGTGPVTLNEDADIRLECGGVTNPLTLNGGTIEGGTWNAPITLNGIAKLAGSMNLNELSGGISGPGGFTQIGPIGPFSRVNAGELSLWGVNTYAGPTTVHVGTLVIRKAVSLYNADPSKWTAANITVHPAATLRICAGGPGELTGAQVATLLKNLTASVNNNGLMAGAVFCLDTARATATVAVASDIPDAQGPGGGPFLLKKCGAGTVQLSGASTYTGQTVVEGGSLSVASVNRVAGGKASSSLGAPTHVETGEIVFGSGDGEAGLIYTGAGETTDRVINLAGKSSTVTFDQSGTGLLKLTSPLLISGYGASKIIVLKGDTAGTGELAGDIANPHDRTGKATTAVTKSGTGIWTLSGTNSYTGPTRVLQGTLSVATARSLGAKIDVYLSEGAKLDLNFKGEMQIGRLYLDGKPQDAGALNAENAPAFIKGTGVLRLMPSSH
jgi:autotransporter-associated beta strand protein